MMLKRNSQMLRLLEWVRKYPGWWYLICTPDNGYMNIKIMNTLIRHLAQEQLYEIIFVLLMVHRKEKYMKDISNYMLLDIVTENWNGKRKSKEQMIKDILKYFE